MIENITETAWFLAARTAAAAAIHERVLKPCNISQWGAYPVQEGVLVLYCYGPWDHPEGLNKMLDDIEGGLEAADIKVMCRSTCHLDEGPVAGFSGAMVLAVHTCEDICYGRVEDEIFNAVDQVVGLPRSMWLGWILPESNDNFLNN
jgi:hypothetical protein